MVHESLGNWTEFQFGNANCRQAFRVRQEAILDVNSLDFPTSPNLMHWILIRWFWADSEIILNGERNQVKMMWNGWSKHGGQRQHGNMDSKLPHNRPSHPYLRHQCHRITICSTITNLNLAKDTCLECFSKSHAYSAIHLTMGNGDLARCTQMKV